MQKIIRLNFYPLLHKTGFDRKQKVHFQKKLSTWNHLEQNRQKQADNLSHKDWTSSEFYNQQGYSHPQAASQQASAGMPSLF